MSYEELDRLSALIVGGGVDPDANIDLGTLMGMRDREAFVGAVVDLAKDRALDVTEADVVAALRAARRRWQERWV